ncbi:PLxRFG domain-containing protein [Brucella sp. HL-2]|nr:PLxRFG domain-containing protein [Brucella sp. HL-2]MCV9910180.1 PLxRFG domain-containing protein [Brucella sp. HL-2]
MPAIKLVGFRGEQPRIIPRLLGDAAAQSAINVRLDDGGLTPRNMSVQVARAESAQHKTIFKHQDRWLSWDKVVNCASGAVATERLYYTGDGAPKMRIGDTVYPLSIPRPQTALTATIAGTGTGDTQARLYSYTYVTDLGEETEPSPASNLIDWKPGQTVTLSGFVEPPAGRRISTQRIYRSQTSASGTFFYFLAERSASANDFADSIGVDDFGEALPSGAWNTPPDELTGLISMPNGMMAAFVGQSLYFCEPYRPHAWPEKYVLRTDSAIIGLGAIGTSLIVMTKAQPYLAAGSTPDSMQMVKIEANFPCINSRGIVDMGFAIAYPSNEGLIAVTADGQARNVTERLMSRDDWLDIGPSTFIGGQISGQYIAFYDLKDVKGNPKSGAVFFQLGDTPDLVRSDAIASTTFFEVESSSLFYMAKGDANIYRFDSPEGARQEYYWRSKDFHMPFPMSYGVIQIDTDAMYSPRAEENYKRTVAEVTARNNVKIAQGIPILGARLGGMGKAAVALAKASSDVLVKGRGRAERSSALNESERNALAAFYDSGLIDRTQSHDLAGVGETGVEYSPVWANVMEKISWAFHNAEVFNREVTALAAFRMAKERGMRDDQAIDMAHSLTWKTHFDYSNSSRPTIMQGDTAKLLFVFRSHNVNMIYRVVRDVQQAFKGDTAQAKSEARAQLAGVFGMMSLMGGVTGVFGYNLAMTLLGAVFGDDDDPFTFEEKFKKSMVDVLGPNLGGAVLNGAIGHYAGINLTSRIGMADIWFRSPTRELKGKDEYNNFILDSLGATVSMGRDWYAGAQNLMEGKYYRGIETMSPKVLKDALKAYRYMSEGVVSGRGDEVLPADAISSWDVIAQAMGFSPAKVAETWDRNSSLKNAEQRIKERRQELINRFSLAVNAGDADAKAEVIKQIQHFNSVPINKPMAITGKTLHQSQKAKAKNRKKREDGVLIQNKRLGKELRLGLPDLMYR